MPKVNYNYTPSHVLFRLQDNSDPLYLSLTPKFTPEGKCDRISARIVYQNCPVERQTYHFDLVGYVDVLQPLRKKDWRKEEA